MNEVPTCTDCGEDGPHRHFYDCIHALKLRAGRAQEDHRARLELEHQLAEVKAALEQGRLPQKSCRCECGLVTICGEAFRRVKP